MAEQSTVTKCVALSNATSMRLGVSILADVTSGDIKLSVEYYDNSDCEGTVLGDKSISKTANPNNWRNIWSDSKVPTSTASVKIVVEINANLSPVLVDRTYYVDSEKNL